MYEEWETIRSDDAPGLVAVVRQDDWWENPLGWVGIREHGACAVADVEGEWTDEPALITCPKCGGDGEIILHAIPVGCPRCGGTREVIAENESEWCGAMGAAAAVPVNYCPDTSQPFARVADWGDRFTSVFYLPKGTSDASAEMIESQVRVLHLSFTEGFYYFFVEVDEDSDLPDDVLARCDLGCGGFLGYHDAEWEAEQALGVAADHVKRELAERESWAKRDVVTA